MPARCACSPFSGGETQRKGPKLSIFDPLKHGADSTNVPARGESWWWVIALIEQPVDRQMPLAAAPLGEAPPAEPGAIYLGSGLPVSACPGLKRKPAAPATPRRPPRGLPIQPCVRRDRILEAVQGRPGGGGTQCDLRPTYRWEFVDRNHHQRW